MLLEQKIDQTSYKEWTRDQMCATLFLTYADVEMSKVVTSLINKDKLNMVELRAQIRALEVQRILPNYQVPLEEQDQMELLQVGSGALTAPATITTLISAEEFAHTAKEKGTKLKNADLRRMLRQNQPKLN